MSRRIDLSALIDFAPARARSTDLSGLPQRDPLPPEDLFQPAIPFNGEVTRVIPVQSTRVLNLVTLFRRACPLLF